MEGATECSHSSGRRAMPGAPNTPRRVGAPILETAMAVPTSGRHSQQGAARLLPLPRGVRAAAADHRWYPLDPLLRRPGRRGSDPRLGHDGRRPRGGCPVRLRRTGLVRPQGAAPRPGGDIARQDRRPGVAAGHPPYPPGRRAIARSGPRCVPPCRGRRARTPSWLGGGPSPGRRPASAPTPLETDQFSFRPLRVNLAV